MMISKGVCLRDEVAFLAKGYEDRSGEEKEKDRGVVYLYLK